MLIQSCARTDRGLLRDGNEDALLCDPKRRLFAVADGMGGHAAGEVASAMAIERLESVHPPHTAETLTRAVHAANEAILAAGRESPGRSGMGTTVTILALRDSEAVWAHVGDSRLYLYRNQQLSQLTRDQTWVQQQVDAGLLTPEQARVHPRSSLLSQALGMPEPIEPETGRLQFYPGDRFLLCSDGLTGMLRDHDIAAILADHASCESAVRELIERANQQGGTDNITAVLVDLPATH